jgi:hypothetical protein
MRPELLRALLFRRTFEQWLAERAVRKERLLGQPKPDNII